MLDLLEIIQLSMEDNKIEKDQVMNICKYVWFNRQRSHILLPPQYSWMDRMLMILLQPGLSFL